MTHHRVLAGPKRPRCIPNPTAIHGHLADQAFDLRFVAFVGVGSQKTLFAGVTAVTLCAVFCPVVPFDWL